MRKSKWIVVIAVVVVLGAAWQCVAQGSRFEIRSATYEATDGSGKADVTEKVRSMVRDGKLSLQASNKVLGGDPTPGHRKRLRVEYAVGGKTEVVVVGENETLQIPPVAPWETADKLIPVLKSPDASLYEKSDACRQLAITGGKDAIPVLAGLLADEKLSHMARYALQPIPDPAVDDAFRAALGQVKGMLLVGVINSIGVRRDAKAIGALTKLLGDGDDAVASAAAAALGRIGTSESAKAIDQGLATARAEIRSDLYAASLCCADALRAQGKTGEAQAIYDRVRASQAPVQIRMAALRDAILVRGSGGATMLVEQLRSGDSHRIATALRVTLELPGTDVTQALAAELPKLPADRQPRLIQALAKRGDRAALPALLAAAKSGDKDVRLAAIRALPEMGDPSAAAALVEMSCDADTQIAKAAQNSLGALAGKQVDDIVVGLLEGEDTSRRIIAIELVARRRLTGALPTLVKATSDANQDIRLAALKTLGELGSAAEIQPLLDGLIRTEDRKDRTAAEKALSSICARQPNPDDCAQILITPMAQSGPEQKCAILHILTAIGGPKALAAVRGAVKDPNADVHATAIRALGKWQTADAADPLLELAKTSTDKTDKLLCLRSYLGLAGNSRLPAGQRLAICKEGQKLIERDDETKLLLGVLGGIAVPESFAMVMPYLDKPPVKEEAAAAVLSIGDRLMRNRREARKNAPKVIGPLEKAAKTTSNAGLKKRINAVLDKAKGKRKR